MPDKAFAEELRQFFQSTEDGEAERFKYKIIEGLSESIRQMVAQMTKVQETQVDMLIRLARLEENKIAEEIVEIKGLIATLEVKIAALMRDKDERAGASKVFKSIPVWLQFIMGLGGLVSAIWLIGRSLGVVPAPPPAPPVAPVRIEGHVDEQVPNAIAGGKP